MKKTYLIPAMQVELAALTKEDTSWNIWNEE